MRILLINHFPLQGSGSGVYVANIAKSLEKKGHKTCIITPENTSDFSDIKGIKLHPVFFKYKEEIENRHLNKSSQNKVEYLKKYSINNLLKKTILIIELLKEINAE